MPKIQYRWPPATVSQGDSIINNKLIKVEKRPKISSTQSKKTLNMLAEITAVINLKNFTFV
jgi:hypothetical protein